jgi:multidrug efflux pump subunit AcrA (membrane-fusion protein)
MIQRFHRLSIRGKGMVIAVLLLAGSGVVWGAARLGKRSPTVPTVEVKRGEFLDSTQFRGEVKALKSITISAPAEAGDLQIVKVSPEGTVVKSGDVVVEFDKTKTEQDLAQFRSALKSAEAEIEQARAQARLAKRKTRPRC